MLVLCGETYVQRLWCAWELFTLFAFQDQQQALAKIMLVPLVDPIIARRLGHDVAHDVEGSPVLATLLTFNVADAMCYDPNEELRLRQIIAETRARTRARQRRGVSVDPNRVDVVPRLPSGVAASETALKTALEKGRLARLQGLREELRKGRPEVIRSK